MRKAVMAIMGLGMRDMDAVARVFTIAVLSLSSVCHASPGCADNVANCYSTVTQCPTPIVDMYFALDRSSSMRRGVKDSYPSQYPNPIGDNCTKALGVIDDNKDPKTYWIDSGAMEENTGCQIGTTGTCEDADNCNQDVTKCIYTGCRREHVTRAMLRQVVKKIFLELQRGCVEYIANGDAFNTGSSCIDRGYTLPRFTVVFWSGDKFETINQYPTITFKEMMLQGPTDEYHWSTTTDNRGGFWNDEFTDYFWNRNPTDNSYTFDDDKWIQETNNTIRMKDSKIDEFFEEIFLKDSYPAYGGVTRMSEGINAASDIFNNGNFIDPEKASFPLFLLTDGELYPNTNGVETHKTKLALDLFKERVELKKGTFTSIGLGISGNNVENGEKQRILFTEDLGVTNYKSIQKIEDVDDVVKLVTDEVLDKCVACYIVNGNLECNGLPPSNNEERPENTVYHSTAQPTVTFETLSEKAYIKLDGDIYEIDGGQEVCYFEDVNKYQTHTYASQSWTCDCCGSKSGCMCDFRIVSATEDVEMINGQEREIPDFSESHFGAWFRQNQDDFNKYDTTAASTQSVLETMDTTAGAGGDETTEKQSKGLSSGAHILRARHHVVIFVTMAGTVLYSIFHIRL